MNKEFKTIFFDLIDEIDNTVFDGIDKQIIKEKFINAELKLSLNELKASIKKDEIRTRTINVKGDIPASFKDYQTGKPFVDISYGYGKIHFTGTDEEESQFLDYLVTNEGKLGFKII